jgi:2-methylcitrate dehydratase PrpD
MILRRWAGELADDIPVSDETQRVIDLHVADAAVAFFAGSRTQEARALARFFGSSGASAARHAGELAAIIRHTEVDDIHVAACVTAGAAVVPTVLAFMQSGEDGARRSERAIAAGYATGIRVGLAIGGTDAFSSGVWPSLFAAPMMAAATASVCLGLDARQAASALALAAAGSSGRIGRIPASPSGRWLIFGEAVAKGSNAALAAQAGFHGDPDLVTPDWLAASVPGVAIREGAFSALSIDEAIRSVGFKPFVAARQTINAIHAFRAVMARENLDARRIDGVEVGVPTPNAAMVARTPQAGDRLGTISSMAIQIAAAALRPNLLYDVERMGVPDAELAAFMPRVSVAAAPELDVHLPDIWAGRARVTAGDRHFEETYLSTPGDRPETAESVVRDKLDRMVPASLHQICLAQIAEAMGEERTVSRHRLLKTMLEVLHSGEIHQVDFTLPDDLPA